MFFVFWGRSMFTTVNTEFSIVFVIGLNMAIMWIVRVSHAIYSEWDGSVPGQWCFSFVVYQINRLKFNGHFIDRIYHVSSSPIYNVFIKFIKNKNWTIKKKFSKHKLSHPFFRQINGISQDFSHVTQQPYIHKILSI